MLAQEVKVETCFGCEGVLYVRVEVNCYEAARVVGTKWNFTARICPIIDNSTSKMIGTIELYNHSPLFKAELGYALNPKYWGKGIIPEAVNEVVAFAFEFLSLKRFRYTLIYA